MVSFGTEMREASVRYNAKASAVFTQAGWNRVVRESGNIAGGKWLAHYGVLRWNKGYAQSALGYSPGAKKRLEMTRGGLPFYHSGAFQSLFNSAARVQTVAKGGIPVIKIRFNPLGLAFSPRHLAAFRNTPPAEVNFVAREFRRAALSALMTARTAAATEAQRAVRAKADRIAARRSAAADRRAQRREYRRSESHKAQREQIKALRKSARGLRRFNQRNRAA